MRALTRACSVASDLVLNLLLVPPLCALCAGIATVISYSAYTSINVYYSHRELAFDLGSVGSDPARIAVVALAMVGVALRHRSVLTRCRHHHRCRRSGGHLGGQRTRRTRRGPRIYYVSVARV